MTIEAPASRPSSRKGVRVDSNTVRRVDAQLEVSGVTETVEVTAAAPCCRPIAPTSTSRRPPRQVNDLPLTGSLGRNYQSLMQVVPGA